VPPEHKVGGSNPSGRAISKIVCFQYLRLIPLVLFRTRIDVAVAKKSPESEAVTF
jgi:hypothetical protein